MESNFPTHRGDLSRAVLPAVSSAQSFGGVSLVIPAWNEEETIVQAICEADEALSNCADTYEVLVVDDGSTDRTFELAQAEAAQNLAVRVIRQERNRGYGAALRTGFIAARYELVAFTDADCQFDLSDLEYMLPLAARYDIVSGYRIDRQDSRLRRFYSWGYNTLVQLLLGSPVRDIDCALKVFHRSHLPAIVPESSNFFANTEMFSRAQMEGLTVVDTGVRHRPRLAGQSKVSVLDIPKTLSSLLPFWWNRVLFAGRSIDEEKPGSRFWSLLLVLAVVAGVMIFSNLSYPLIEPDEGRYAEIPREMLASGDWVVPHFQNRPYLDKPPLFYWLCAGSYCLFGPSDWAARLVPATATFLSILLTFAFGSRMVGTRAAFIGGLVLTLNVGFAGCGRFLVLDSLLTLFVVCSLFAAWRATRGKQLAHSWWLLSGAACGLGVLTKGPVAFALLFVPIVAQTLLSRQSVRPTVQNWFALIAIAALVNAPWCAAMAIRNPRFFVDFFWQHNVMRFLVGAEHPHGAWYYIPVVFLGWMPWALLLAPLCGFLFARSQAMRQQRPLALGFLLLWAGWCILFFSISRGKLPSYIMPAFPAMALLLGYFVNSVLETVNSHEAIYNYSSRLFRRATPLFCALGLVLTVVATSLHWLSPFQSALRFICWGLALAAILAIRKTLSLKAVVAACGMMGFITVFDGIHVLLPGWATYRATLPTFKANVLEELQDSTNAVACYGQDWGSVPFYLDRNDVRMIAERSKDELSRFVAQRERSYVIIHHSIDPDSLRELLPVDATMDTVSKSPRATIIFVQTPDQQAHFETDHGAVVHALSSRSFGAASRR